MRTYDDSFSGQKIYPGKVRSLLYPSVIWGGRNCAESTTATHRDANTTHESDLHRDRLEFLRTISENAGFRRMLILLFVVTG